jgi:hypothetical protein
MRKYIIEPFGKPSLSNKPETIEADMVQILDKYLVFSAHTEKGEWYTVAIREISKVTLEKQ